MSRKVSFNVKNGMDSAARVLTTLRRKNFEVSEFSMKEIDNTQSRLIITVRDKNNLGLERVVLQMKKLVDVYDIKEI